MPLPKMQKIKLPDYLSRLESLLKPEWDKKKIRLTLSIEPSNLILVADESMLDQALINLLRNAADALKGVKKAEVKIRAFLDSKQRVVLEVTDNGPGVDKDLADKIFMPFFTTKKEGSGVGLTLVRYIVLSHGGAITYRPGKTGGSVFRIVF
jgi:C4-dicarboxylate-specific signal transduction histidine kinase